MILSLCPTGQTEGLTQEPRHFVAYGGRPWNPSTNPTIYLFIVARKTIASLTQDNETLVAQLEELKPVKEQLNSLWIVCGIIFCLGVLF